MLSEEIKKLLGEDLTPQVESKLGDKKIIIDDGSLIPKHRFDEVNNKNKTLQTQLETQKTDYDSQISKINAELNTLKQSSQLTETEKQKITDLTSANEKIKMDSDAKIKNLQLQHKVDLKLMESGAKNITAVKALLKMDSITVDGDNLVGFENQLESIKKDNDYLFGEVKKVGDPPKPGGDPQPTDEMQSQLTKLNEEYKKNPNSQLGAQIIALQRHMRSKIKAET